MIIIGEGSASPMTSVFRVRATAATPTGDDRLQRNAY